VFAVTGRRQINKAKQEGGAPASDQSAPFVTCRGAHPRLFERSVTSRAGCIFLSPWRRRSGGEQRIVGPADHRLPELARGLRNHDIPIQWAEKGVRKEDFVHPWLRRNLVPKPASSMTHVLCGLRADASFARTVDDRAHRYDGRYHYACGGRATVQRDL
jgi:hypothetical protein